MSRIIKYGLGFFAVAAIAFASCDKVEPEKPEKPVNSQSTVIISAEEGSVAEFSFTAAKSWVVSNTTTWFKVTPNTGKPGDNELTVTAAKSNPEILERVGFFTVIDGQEKKSYYVVQRGVVSTYLAEDDLFVMTGADEVSVPVSGTYPFEDIKVSVDADWLNFYGMETLSEPSLLEDGITYSNYMEGVARFEVLKENDGIGAREAIVTVTAGEQEFSFAVIQQSTRPAEADFSRDFYKASVMLKFTGTWCGNCPNMSETIHLAQEERPGRLYLVNAHSGSSGNLDWTGTRKLINFFGVEAFPSSYFNAYVELYNSQYNVAKGTLVEVIDEAVTDHKADVAINAVSRVEEGKIKLSLDFASKVSGEYRYTVFIMENGIVGEQAGSGTGKYVHNNILRGSATDGYVYGGDKVTMEQNRVVTEELEIAVPSNIVDINNVNVLVYVTVESGPVTGDVQSLNIAYRDFGWIVDNAIQIPVNGFSEFRYE